MVLGLSVKDLVDVLTKGLWFASTKQGCDPALLEQLKAAVFAKLDTANLTCPEVPRCPAYPVPAACPDCPVIIREVLALAGISLGVVVGFLLARWLQPRAQIVYEREQREPYIRPPRDAFESPVSLRQRGFPLCS
jgi:hypothetical protein